MHSINVETAQAAVEGGEYIHSLGAASERVGETSWDGGELARVPERLATVEGRRHKHL